MVDRRIKFRHVQCFVEIARERSFKAAAAKLNLTQPAISKTLKELENILGRALLIRSRSGVDLTPEGAAFLRFAQSSIASLQQGIDGIAASTNAGSQALSVGVLPSVAARLIPSMINGFRDIAPDVVLKIVDGPHGYLVDRLKLGALDYVIGRMGPHDQMKGVSFATLYRERISFVVRAGHPLLKEPTLGNILNWPMVYPPAGSAIRPLVDRFFLEGGIADVPRRIETVSGAFGRVFVQNSDAVWVISESVVTNEVERGILTRLPFDTDTTLGPIGIMEREDWDRPTPARLFRRALHQTIEGSAEFSV